MHSTMSHTPSPSTDTDSFSITNIEQDGGRIRQNDSQSQSQYPGVVPEYSRHCVFYFWGQQILWGVVFAIGATLQLLLPFTMLVLQKAVKLVIWSFGAAGLVAASMDYSVDNSLCWWLLVALSVSLF